MTKDILRKHSHVSSFGAIQKDCEDTVRRLQDKLQKEVDSPVSHSYRKRRRLLSPLIIQLLHQSLANAIVTAVDDPTYTFRA